MRRGYRQYCPLALAAELLCERWTLLIISRLVDGCSQFNEIRRGIPRISPSLLARRLAQLERARVVARSPAKKGVARTYKLSAAGHGLEPIVAELAIWGQHWGRDLSAVDLDPAFLAWSMHMRLDPASMPPGRTVCEFEFTGAPSDCRRFWLINEGGIVDMCLKHPGHEVDLRVAADLRLFIEAWRGIRDLRSEIHARRIRLVGPASLCKQFPVWLKLSALASYPRMKPGREQRLSQESSAGSVPRPLRPLPQL